MYHVKNNGERMRWFIKKEHMEQLEKRLREVEDSHMRIQITQDKTFDEIKKLRLDVGFSEKRKKITDDEIRIIKKLVLSFHEKECPSSGCLHYCVLATDFAKNKYGIKNFYTVS